MREKAKEVVVRMIEKGFNLHTEAIKHMSQDNEVSYEEYVHKELVNLNDKYKRYRKIYLDTKYWILLRDVKIGVEKDPESILLYDLILKLKEDGIVFCPISASNLFEILRQHDEFKRMSTIKIMDELSNGMCLRSHYERAIDDFKRVIYRSIDQEYSTQRIDFNFISHILGGYSLEIDSSLLSDDIRLAYKKAYYEMGKLLTLEDIQDGINRPELHMKISDQEAWSIKMNAYKATIECRSFDEIKMGEFLEGIKTSNFQFREAMKIVYTSIYDKKVLKEETDAFEKVSQEVVSILCQAFEKKKLAPNLLPQLYIQAAFFGKVLTEKGRTIKKNDFDDVWHASDALPSCQLFFTENYLSYVLNHPPTNLATEFNAIVVSKKSEAIQELSKLIK